MSMWIQNALSKGTQWSYEIGSQFDDALKTIQEEARQLGSDAKEVLDEVQEFVQESLFSIDFLEVANASKEVVFDGFIMGRTTWLSRNIERWTMNQLGAPRSIAELTARVAAMIPFAVVELFVPSPVSSIIFSTCMGARIFDQINNAYVNTASANFQAPYGTTSIVMGASGLRSLSQGVALRSPISAIIGIVKLILGAWLFQRSALPAAIAECYPDVKDILIDNSIGNINNSIARYEQLILGGDVLVPVHNADAGHSTDAEDIDTLNERREQQVQQGSGTVDLNSDDENSVS